jgi:plastocyanin
MKYLTGRAAVALALGGLLLLMLGPSLIVAADGSVTINEVSEKYRYEPKDLTVAIGTTVTWTNDSDAEHTVTADDDSFDHDGIGPGDTASQTFHTAGTFAYHCDIHTYMHGTVTVLAAGQTPPATDITGQNGSTSTPGSIPWLPLLAGALALIVLSGWVALPRREEKR